MQDCHRCTGGRVRFGTFFSGSELISIVLKTWATHMEQVTGVQMYWDHIYSVEQVDSRQSFSLTHADPQTFAC